MRPSISIIIPAYNESEYLPETLSALHGLRTGGQTVWDELIVVDDGSSDGTLDAASGLAKIIRHPRNLGKGRAMQSGAAAAAGGILVFLDADLGSSAVHAGRLLAPLLEDAADMAVAVLPAPARRGGFGFARTLARRGIARLCGFEARAPLSGQRAVRSAVLRELGPLAEGFGVEVALTIEAVRRGYRVTEVPVPFCHRETGRSLQDICHRGRQFAEISRALVGKWRSGGASR